jgi:hypothetical protein
MNQNSPDPADPSAERPLDARAPRAPRVLFVPILAGRQWLWLLGVPACAAVANECMRHVSLPVWLRVLLSLAPLLPGVRFLQLQREAFAKADELQLHIVREAFAFTFYALIGTFISVDLLENAGVLHGFAWDTKRLIVAMVCLLGLGTAWSARRYR